MNTALWFVQVNTWSTLYFCFQQTPNVDLTLIYVEITLRRRSVLYEPLIDVFL